LINQDLQKLAPGQMVELFELDCSNVGGAVLRFHNGQNQLGADVVWQGNTYTAYPIEATGFEFRSQGQLPRPTLRAGNIAGLLGALVRTYQDLVGCKLTRRRTLLKYLDAVNFPGGVNPSADPTAALPDDVYFVDRKANETKVMIEFELAAAFDTTGVQLPRRFIVQNICPWAYRGAECGYTGTAYFDANDTPAAALGSDVCGKRLSSCKARFGQYAELPFGGFPAAGLVG
jgi:lambda family phage minor tail protein L